MHLYVSCPLCSDLRACVHCHVLYSHACIDIAQNTNFFIAHIKDAFNILDRFFVYKRSTDKHAAVSETATAVVVVKAGKRKTCENSADAQQGDAHGVNCFAVACRDGRMTGKYMKNINFEGKLPVFEFRDDYVVRFRSDGMVLLGDLLVGMKKHVQFDNAQKAIKHLIETDHHIVRGLDVVTDNTLTRLVRVVSRTVVVCVPARFVCI